MAQTGFTPISIYYSTTASATPTAGNLVAGELAINTTDGKLFYKDSSGVVQTIASKAGALGDVVGPASATDNALARFDATTGKLIQNSVGILSDAGALTGITDFTYTGTLTGGTGVVNLGSGQFYKDASGFIGLGTSSPDTRLTVRKTDVDGNIITIQGANGVNGAIGVHAGGNGGVYLQAAATRDLRLRVGTTELFTVDKDKSASLQGASPQTGTGITFPATQSASSDANTLDDYEEGTWTPLFGFGTVNSTGLVYGSSNNGYYTKIGRQVTVVFLLDISVKGVATGAATMGGFPFSPINSTSARGGIAIGFVTGTNVTIPQFMLSTGTGSGVFRIPNGGDMNETNFGTSFQIYASYTYFVA